MDPTLIALAMTALSTFFGKAIEGAATKAGEVTVEQAQRAFEAIKERFHKEHDDGKASRALTAMADDPDTSETVQVKLERILTADPEFVLRLQQILQPAHSRQAIHLGKDSVTEDVDMLDRTGAAHQQLVTEERAQASRIRIQAE